MGVSAVSDVTMSSGAMAANFIFNRIYKSNRMQDQDPIKTRPRQIQEQRQKRTARSGCATLGRQAVEGLEHFVGGAYDAGIRFVGALREDHVDEFGDDIDVGLLDVALLNRAKAFGSSGRADNGVARSSGGREEILADAIEPAGILKCGELKRTDLSGLLLAWLGDADGAVVADCDRERIGRNRDAGLELITVLRDEVADVVEGEISGSRVRKIAARHEHM